MTISWKKLKCHRGSALRLPKAIEGLIVGDSPSTTDGDISEDLMHEDKWDRGILPPDERWVEASAPAIDLLLSGLARAKRPEWVLGYVADLAGALHEDGWLGSPETYLPDDLAAVLRAHLPTLEKATKSRSPAVRACACLVLALEPSSETSAVRSTLIRLFDQDGAPTVRASALLGLARYAESADIALVERLLHDKAAPEIVRGAACLAALRIAPKRSLVSLREGLECWFSIPTQGDEKSPLGWFGSGLKYPIRSHASKGLTDAAWAMHQLARRFGCWSDWCEPLLAMGLETDSPMVRRNVSDLLEQNEFSSQDEGPRLCTRADLSKRQLDLLERIGPKMLLVNTWGLPVAGPVRMRHFGWAKASLLETPVTVEVDGKSVKMTFSTTNAKAEKHYLPEVLALSPAKRWRVLTELSVSLFHPSGIRVIGDELTQLLDEASVDPEIKKVAPPVISEIAHWYAEARAQNVARVMWPEVAELILAPAARAGVRLEPEWECLLPEELPLKSAVALVQALPENRRESWLLAHPQFIKVVPSLLELVPGTNFAKHYMLRMLTEPRAKKSSDQRAALEARIRALAKNEKRFAQAIHEAEAEFAKGDG